jgi:hypothetical protein
LFLVYSLVSSKSKGIPVPWRHVGSVLVKGDPKPPVLLHEILLKC